MYPVIDFHSSDVPSIYPSYSENAEGFGVTNTHMGLFWDLYIEKEEDRNHPYASPIKAVEVSDLPPALLFTAEYDVLRDEGEAYGQRLVMPVFLLRQKDSRQSFMVFCNFLLIKRRPLKL